jgi:hypothetical protein
LVDGLTPYERKQAAAHRKAVHAARKVVAIWNG